MDEFDTRATALLLAVLVALATVPSAAILDGATADSASPARHTTMASETTTTATATTTISTTTDDGGAPDHEVEPLPLPDRPDPLNETSVLGYVVAYEQARKHDEILDETTDVTITHIDVLCSPTSLDEQADGFAVEVTCGFSYEFGENGTPTGIADGAPYTARYLVSENATELRGLWSALGSGMALPLPLPEIPDPSNEIELLIHTADYEEVRKRNELIETVNQRNRTVTATAFVCRPELVEQSDDAAVVDVTCEYSYQFRTDDGSVGVVEGVPYTARYRITDDSTELVGVRVVGENRTTTSSE